MDETSVLFENPSTKTIARKGENTISMATTGHEKACVTVILSATSGESNNVLYLFNKVEYYV